MERIARGELSEDTLAWHKGCAEWMPLGQLPAMRHYRAHAAKKPHRQHSAPAAPAGTLPFERAEETLPHPARSAQAAPLTLDTMKLYMPSALQRFFARMIDCSLYLALYAIIIYVLRIPFSMLLFPSNPMLWLPLILLEAFVIFLLRTSLGKKVMGVRIFSLNPHEEFTLTRSLRRSVLVYIFGMGMMFIYFPIPITLVTMGVAFWHLRTRRISSWDLQAQSIPLQKRPAKFFSYLSALGLIVLNLEITLHCLAPWKPAMEEHIAELRVVFPEILIDKLLPEQEEPVRQIELSY